MNKSYYLNYFNFLDFLLFLRGGWVAGQPAGGPINWDIPTQPSLAGVGADAELGKKKHRKKIRKEIKEIKK